MKRINEIDSGLFFTISTEQNVTSPFNVESIEAERISCQYINDIDFNTEVATNTKNVVVKGAYSVYVHFFCSH